MIVLWGPEPKKRFFIIKFEKGGEMKLYFSSYNSVGMGV